MDIERQLKELIKNETDNTKKTVFFMLMKFSTYLTPIENEGPKEYLPLITIANGRITLFYEDAKTDAFRRVFHDAIDILIVLQILFHENRSVYFYCKEEKHHSVEELVQLMDKALKEKDVTLYQKYQKELKRKR